ncbi:MAG TPA: decaprenyl-phosphate phosphoribosyltransferase, partial [Myxococcales bacterium]|nr:decaprenyl-phosphate phosphoribosyltransferase [Myxococcales bacterium]
METSLPAELPARSMGRTLGALLRSARPRQWVKNGALLAPLIFSRRVGFLDSMGRAAVAVGLFCAIVSAVYLFNDILDRDRDRAHPEKRFRPIAAGELSIGVAGGAAAVLAVGGLAGSVALSLPFGGAAAAYLLLQLGYSLFLKHLVLIDVFAIAAGFVLRVVAGGLAIAVPLSNWLYLCTLLLALFLALAKRRAELATLEGEAEAHRKNLALYSVPLLDQLIGVVSACTILAYSLYTLAPETVQKFGTDGLKFTIPCVIFGLFRYLFLIHR